MAEQAERFARNPDFVFRMVADEAVLVPIRRRVADMECIYTLNETGAFLWERLESPATEDELRRAMLDAFEVDAGTVNADLQSFLQGLVEVDAIRRL